jgi:hypothetical protein
MAEPFFKGLEGPKTLGAEKSNLLTNMLESIPEFSKH